MGQGSDLAAAAAVASIAADTIGFDGAQRRHDIAVEPAGIPAGIPAGLPAGVAR
jgi:hypothetical protein